MLLFYISDVWYNGDNNMAIIPEQADMHADISILSAAKSGDTTAFGKLYDLYIKKIYDFIYYKTLNKEVAEDITSTVFMKAWKNIQQFSSGSFAAWLYAIARNATSDYYRSLQNNLDIEDCWDLADKTNFLEQIDVDLKVDSIKEAMQSLRSQDREIIIMRFWLDLSFKEIAEQLNRQEGAVKMSLSRALKKLREQLPLVSLIFWPVIINICKKIN